MEPEIWSTNPSDIHCMIESYKNRCNDDRKLRTLGSCDILMDRKKKAEAARRKKEEAKFPTWDDECNNLSEEQLREIGGLLERKFEALKSRVESMKRGQSLAEVIQEQQCNAEIPLHYPFNGVDPTVMQSAGCVGPSTVPNYYDLKQQVHPTVMQSTNQIIMNTCNQADPMVMQFASYVGPSSGSAATNARTRLGGFSNGDGVQVNELALIEGDLGVLSIVVNLHRFDVGGSDLAMRALELGVSALDESRPVGLTRLAPAPVGGCSVDLRRDLLRRVLLRLRLSGHRFPFKFSRIR
ncbi:hypothetical protein F0562_031150 [Nyssa sinensis]|uniref:MADS-box domain-containing protein n=1 Tax=Nyssa sinensis TaxID=561372 RepID=A0A5J5AU91_9ASTE|nr:hypothetical protein F0562_031150 [Nyssa sinensis]